MPQDGQLQHPMAQQHFELPNFQEYSGEYPSPTIQQTIHGQFNQQNWEHQPAFGSQQRGPGQPQNGFGGYQQATSVHGQQIYGGSSQAGLVSYQPRPGHHLRQAFTLHPQGFLAPQHQQAVTVYENIDPAILGMDTNQPSRPDTSLMTVLQPPLTPRIVPQDFLHPYAYSGIQNGQDVSPLTIENPQFPVLLPPSPEVASDGFEHRGQSIIPDPFAQISVLTLQPQFGLGTDLHHSSGANGFDHDTFDQALALSSGINDATPGHENSRESGYFARNVVDQSGDQKMNAEGSIAEEAGQNSYQNPTSILHTTVEEAVESTPSTNQEPLSEAHCMEWDKIEEASESEDLFKLFLDLEYQDPLGCNFNFDGSMIGSGAIDNFENDLSKNNPKANSPQEKRPCDAKSSLGAMEAVGKDLETGMAGPFLAQNSTGHNEDSAGIQCSDSGKVEGGWAPEGTCCASHQNFECYFEVPDSDGESATVSKG